MPVSGEYMPTSGEYMPLTGNIRYIVCVGALIRPRNGVQIGYTPHRNIHGEYNFQQEIEVRSKVNTKKVTRNGYMYR